MQLLVRHPTILQLHACFDTPAELHLLLELANGGELFDRIVAKVIALAGRWQIIKRRRGALLRSIGYVHIPLQVASARCRLAVGKACLMSHPMISRVVKWEGFPWEVGNWEGFRVGWRRRGWG